MKKDLQISDSILKELENISQKYQLPQKGVKIFLFGSRSQGKAKNTSDIDIGLLSKNSISIQIKDAITEDLEKLRILSNIDLVDFSFVNEEFKKEALKTAYFF